MLKIDFKKETPALYRPSAKKFSIVDVPTMTFLMVDGKGNPNTTPAYQDAIATLYPLAYKLKFHSKNMLGRDYVVPPLEGLWWAEDMTAFTERRLDEWQWTLMIRQPGWISKELFEETRNEIVANRTSLAVDDVQLATYCEGIAIQIMHIGPYDKEGPTLAQMHNDVIPSKGFKMAGKHHEIYLSDPRRTAPERLRTILRQPVKAINKKAGSKNDPASLINLAPKKAA